MGSSFILSKLLKALVFIRTTLTVTIVFLCLAPEMVM